MNTISAAEFKANCLAILDSIDASGLVITRRGKPIATLYPAPRQNNADLIGSLASELEILGDIEGDISGWDVDAQP